MQIVIWNIRNFNCCCNDIRFLYATSVRKLLCSRKALYGNLKLPFLCDVVSCTIPPHLPSFIENDWRKQQTIPWSPIFRKGMAEKLLISCNSKCRSRKEYREQPKSWVFCINAFLLSFVRKVTSKTIYKVLYFVFCHGLTLEFEVWF